jgi:hypothetical protein
MSYGAGVVVGTAIDIGEAGHCTCMSMGPTCANE